MCDRLGDESASARQHAPPPPPLPTQVVKFQSTRHPSQRLPGTPYIRIRVRAPVMLPLPRQAADANDFRLANRQESQNVVGRKAPRRSEAVLLLRQWFAAAFRRHEYVSLQIISETGDRRLQAFQVLDLERRSLIVRPFIDPDEDAEMQGLYMMSLQPLELWNGHASSDLPGSTLEAFVLMDPMKVDVIAACGVDPESRKGVHVWGARLSDVDGCTTLHDPQPMMSRAVDLMSPQVPVLSLLDSLTTQGFIGIEEVVRHTEACRFFDCRRASSRRAYLQCVLHIGALLAKGVSEFYSSGSNAYFEALLRGKRKVPAGLSALEYRKVLAADRGDDLALAALDARTGKTPRGGRARPKALPIVPQAPPPPIDDGVASSRHSDSIFGGSAALLDDDDPQACGVASHAPDEIAQAPSEAMSGRSLRLPPGVPQTISGVMVRFVPGRATATHTYSDRLSVKCTNASHGQCAKSRSCALLQSTLGPRAAEAFLGAWLAKADAMEAGAHSKHMPKLPDMEAYLAAHS